MDHQSAAGTNTSRSEGERLLGIAEKLLMSRDLTGSREFALLAQETEPLLEGSDQILAITDVLLASERRVNNNRHHDWYAILQTDRRSDPDLVKKNYRRLALLLHPDKNKYPLSDSAFKLVADAWSVLSDPVRRNPYDHELSLFSKVDLRHQPPPAQQPDKDKLPIRRSTRGGGEGENPTTDSPATGNKAARNRVASFWTACPYCYVLYEYPRSYEECCLRCQNCERAFHATPIPSLPPMVPGKEAYYCCWGFFPLGFSLSKAKEVGGNVNNRVNNNAQVNNNNNSDNPNSGFPNWMPGMLTPPVGAAPQPVVNMNVSAGGGSGSGVEATDGSDSAGLANNRPRNISGGYNYTPPGMPVPGQKKRGRPRKNPLPV